MHYNPGDECNEALHPRITRLKIIGLVTEGLPIFLYVATMYTQILYWQALNTVCINPVASKTT